MVLVVEVIEPVSWVSSSPMLPLSSRRRATRTVEISTVKLRNCGSVRE